jgi:tetratricopeptide (TPR) repeat protein
LVNLVLVALIALQQVQVEAVIDRNRVMLGETVALTITVEATGNEPVQILNPSTIGLEILGTTDQSDVSIRDGVATRVLTRTLRLQAAAAGPARIGATTVRLGESIAQTGAIEVLVVADDDASAATLAPHIRQMVERHRPPSHSPDEVFVEVLTSTDSVVLGQQLDLAVIAWFPQQVRSQLRTPPTLQPPELQGAWTYSHGVPHAVDLRRDIGGTRYQVYVHSVVVFPLTPGNLQIGPATVSYSLPMSYSFLSREVRHEPQSDSTRVLVAKQPEEGRPLFFEGAAGSRLEFTLQADPSELTVGGASVVTATLRGEGNVALWPEPRIRWPEGLRAYPEGVEVSLVPDSERIAGSKEFRYLIVPDSSGTHLISELTYPYYDLVAHRYVVLRAPELSIVAEFAAATTTAGQSDYRILMPTGRLGSLARFVEDLPLWVWLLIFVLPPLSAGLVTVSPRLKTTGGSTQSSTERELDRLEHDFRLVLNDLIGSAERGGGAELAAALRAAGVDAPIAAHAARVRERLWQANYGPESGGDPEELTAEVNEILKALGGAAPTSTHRVVAGMALLLVSTTAITSGLSGQTAERLYEASALRAAADSFTQRADAEPWVPSHWYNLGAVYERAGELERARRAWIRAARLAPRENRIRFALGQLPPQDVTSSRLTRVSPVTPAEAVMVATCLWILTWVGVALRLQKSFTVPAIVIALACATYGVSLANEYEDPVAIVLSDEVPLRDAPYGPARPRQFLPEGTAVAVVRIEGPWLLVERGVESGWLLSEEVVAIQ